MKPVIIGGGLAGLTVALALAPMPVIVLSPRKLGEECSSAWAQGGIAAAVGANDTASQHAVDTLKAGAALCDPKIVQQVVDDAASVIMRLGEKGVTFDRDAAGDFRLGLEAAHKRHRIVHAAGDGTGWVVMNALVAAVRNTPSIEIREDTSATDLLTDNGVISGVVIEQNGKRSVYATDRVVLATGGSGALWQHTTNPLGSWGRGLALAARAGAVLGDLEFVQFHPTAIDCGRDPMPLASEALRGEGVPLIDETGQRFTDELQPRDIVARAIWNHIQKRHHVFLDARMVLGAKFATRFPSIHALCMSAGIDPVLQPIPVRPAAHYHMGGVVTDARGRTNIDGLWACGEVACTGLHGANRLASNSLLEAASFGKTVAEDIAGHIGGHAMLAKQRITAPLRNDEASAVVRAIVSSHVGVMRSHEGLTIAIERLLPLTEKSDQALVGLMTAAFALQRTESRGAQARTDYPFVVPAWTRRQAMTLPEIMKLVEPFTKVPSICTAVGA